MGSGFWMDCPKCKKQFSFDFGSGYISFRQNRKYVLYYCSKCGNWENKEIKTGKTIEEKIAELEEDIACIEKGLPIPEKPKEKRHVEICSKCKTRMRRMKGTYNEERPLLVCKKCNTKLVFNSCYCWD